jgi:hypothetical protein
VAIVPALRRAHNAISINNPDRVSRKAMQNAYTVIPHHAPYGSDVEDTDARLLGALSQLGITGDEVAETTDEDMGLALASIVGSTNGFVLDEPIGATEEAQTVWLVASHGCGFDTPMVTSEPLRDIVIRYTDGDGKLLGYYCHVAGDGFSALVIPQ